MTDPTPRRPTSSRSSCGAPEAVLWDFDGTLADTEPLWIAAEYELIGRLGGTWSDEHAYQLVGNSLLDSGSYLLHAIGREDLSPAWVVDQLIARVIAGLSGPVPWRPGALELLAALTAAKVPCALVSASYRVVLNAALDRLPPQTFAVSVAGDEVVHGKPHPEPYERACAALGVTPSRCVVFEDSETGARSGNAAGALVVAVPQRLPIPPAPRRVQVSSLTELDLASLTRLLDETDARS